MEFPDLGQNCFFQNCKRLDFLPLKCDVCANIFCKDHFKYENHSCLNAFLKNVQVPLCPLCNQPVPVQRGEPYDIRVNQHIENDCKDNRVFKQRNQIYKNCCEYSPCKQKELIPIICQLCKRNFCLKHRHPSDHSCNVSANAKTSNLQLKRETNDLVSSKKNTKINRNHMLAVQGKLDEDEALALALQQSMNDTQNVTNINRPIILPGSLQNVHHRLSRSKEKCMLS